MNSDFVEVGIIGKSVGLKGQVRFYDKSDFPSQFKKNAKFFDKDGNEFVLKSFNKMNSTALFEGYENIDLAKTLTNKILYTTKELTRKNNKLKDDEFFYFDILGLNVVENGQKLGEVIDIEDNSKDYLLYIRTDDLLVQNGLPKDFYLPYIDNYVLNVDLQAKIINTKNAILILENS